MKSKFVIFIILLVFYFVTSNLLYAANKNTFIANGQIFHIEKFIGENLRYKIRWGFIYAANAGLSVKKLDNNKIQLYLWAKTAPVVRWIYPARDIVCSIVKVPGPKPLHYHKDSKEGWHPRRIVDVIFKNKKCFYYKNNRLKKTLSIKNAVQDPLSAFFVFRCLDFSHSPIRIMITDGKHIVKGEIYVLKKQIITTPAGKFKTILIEPKLHGLRGVFRKSPHAKILVWLTDDKWHIPIMMKSKVIVGYFTAELTSYKLSSLEQKEFGGKR